MSARLSLSTDRYNATTGLPAGQIYSMTCWAYLSVNRTNYSMALAVHGTGTDLGAGALANGLTHGMYDGAGEFTASTAFAVGAWSRFGVSVNGTSVNYYTGDATGALVLTSATRTPPNPPTNFYIGSDLYGEFLNGRVAAVKMWQAALSGAEIADELAQFTPVRTANLLRYHPLHTAELTDYSGNGNALIAGATNPTTEADPPIPEVAEVIYRPTRLVVPGAAAMRAGSW